MEKINLPHPLKMLDPGHVNTLQYMIFYWLLILIFIVISCGKI